MSFDANALERRYVYLDDCPEHLLDQIVTLSNSTLTKRVAGVMRWRQALLTGELPGRGEWPAESIAAPVRAALAQLGIQRFCRGQPELVDVLLGDVIDSFVRQTTIHEQALAQRLDELALLEREQRRKQRRGRRKQGAEELDDATLAELRTRVEQELEQATPKADRDLILRWSERVRLWTDLADVFGDLGELLGRGWDLSLGILRHTGWHDLVRLRALMERLPQLHEIIQSLGRLQLQSDGASVADTILGPVLRIEQERREARTPEIPTEIRGVERGGDLSRMLPSEAVMLGHPQLRWVWHARRAERALLLYRAVGVEASTIDVEVESEVPQPGRRPRRERGPIIAIVDTSGSMHGTPEQVAKALVLETARTAHAERRRCLVFTYSGPGQIAEIELELSAVGIGALLEFLSSSFAGGNDEAGVLREVLARVATESWMNADILFVSDGEWPAPRGLAPHLEGLRAAGGRIHGVQIGNKGRTGLHSICDPVHEFRDWLALVG